MEVLNDKGEEQSVSPEQRRQQIKSHLEQKVTSLQNSTVTLTYQIEALCNTANRIRNRIASNAHQMARIQTEIEQL